MLNANKVVFLGAFSKILPAPLFVCKTLTEAGISLFPKSERFSIFWLKNSQISSINLSDYFLSDNFNNLNKFDGQGFQNIEISDFNTSVPSVVRDSINPFLYEGTTYGILKDIQNGKDYENNPLIDRNVMSFLSPN